MNNSELLEQRIDDLVHGVLASAREVALAAVAEAFARNETQLVDGGVRDGHASKNQNGQRRAKRSRRPAQKRSPEELAALGEKLCAAICEKPGETMTYYAAMVSSTPVKLGVPARRLAEEGRVRSIGDRNQRRYYPGARE
jgi:hypothetical protein